MKASSPTASQNRAITLGLFVAGAVVVASGILYSLTITCFCPNVPVEQCSCYTNGINTRNMILVIGASVIATGGIVHLLQFKNNKRAAGKGE